MQRGGGANATTGAGTERTQWLLLIDALKKRSVCPLPEICTEHGCGLYTTLSYNGECHH